VQSRQAQTLSINVTPVKKVVGELDCGEAARAWWNFELSGDAPCPGYFIQKIEGHCQVDRTCSHCPNYTKLKPNVVFWEAFEVDEDTRVPKHRVFIDNDPRNPAFTDASAVPTYFCSCGDVVWRGFVRFYCKSDTDDLGGFDRDPVDPMSKWRRFLRHGEGDCMTDPANAPSTKDEPDFWTKGPGIAGTAYRDLGATWDCCRKSKFHAFARP
jgi:hypothetical protein